jgi:cyclic beta-1,2-glucan synthetase
MIRLFTPPFEQEGPNPGYIRSYGPGYRENGGQYTHGAIWLAMACLRQGLKAEGLELLLSLLPETHQSEIYGAEPFVLSADVYAASAEYGRGGWSWYTGSAGWFFRVVTEELLGIRLEQGKIQVKPDLPPALESYSAIWTEKDMPLEICVEKGVVRRPEAKNS